MIVVIGAGVVGLASALAFARRGHEVCVVDRHARPGQETSTHNSGVIHAGLYHPADSLKTRLCHEGRERLYAFCAEHDVAHVKCGKLIVATDGEEAELDAVARMASANGARIEAVGHAFVKAREPHVRATRALWSPETGWLEAEAYVRTLVAQVQRYGGVFLPNTPVIAIESQWRVGSSDPATPIESRWRAGSSDPASKDLLSVVTPRETIEAELVVNAAGLYADAISRLAGGDEFRIYPCRGEYAELAPRARHLVKGLVYPVPHASGHGLGVHLTRTGNGAVWIGPTIRYQDDPADYEQHRLPIDAFFAPTQALLPAVTLDDLRLGGSGIRAKLHPPSERFADFLIQSDSRVPRLIHAAGIDSPGLTASLAIGEYVASIARV